MWISPAWRDFTPFRHSRGHALPQPLAAVAAVQHAPAPGLVGEVPVDGLGEPALETLRRPPAELRLELGRVDRVAAIVPRTVLDETDQRFVPRAVRQRPALVEQAADRAHDDEVLALGVTADVVHLARPADLEHAPDRAAVVADVQPVAHVAPVAVHRQLLAGQRLL